MNVILIGCSHSQIIEICHILEVFISYTLLRLSPFVFIGWFIDSLVIWRHYLNCGDSMTSMSKAYIYEYKVRHLDRGLFQGIVPAHAGQTEENYNKITCHDS
jgi:hypothetical protein